MKLAIMLASFLAIAACSDSDSGGKARVSLSLQPVLSGGTATPNALAQSGQLQSRLIKPRVAVEAVVKDCSAVANYPAYEASYGASGAPDSMNLYLKSIVLSTQDSGKTATLFESTDPDGDKITISNANGGTISLAALAAAIDAEVDDEGNTIEAEVNTGTFNQLAVTFRNEADITGCIEQAWAATPQGTSGNQCDETNNEACNVLAAATYKVCTGAATDTTSSEPITIFDLVDTGGAQQSGFTAQAQFSDYVATEAAETQVNLNIRDTEAGDNFSPLADATFNVEVPTVTLEDGGSVNLTLAFDMNLLLRFEGNTRYQRGNPDASQNGDFHPLANVMAALNNDKDLDAAYFHTSYLPDVMAVYIGEPGTVEGYEVLSCYQFKDNSGNLVTGDFRTVESWMTMIFDTSGDLVTGITTPKDDAGMVIVKGSVNKTDATVRPSVNNLDDTYDLLFGDEAYSGAINNWERIGTVGSSNDLLTADVEQTNTSQPGFDNRIEPTWHYIRRL